MIYYSRFDRLLIQKLFQWWEISSSRILPVTVSKEFCCPKASVINIKLNGDINTVSCYPSWEFLKRTAALLPISPTTGIYGSKHLPSRQNLSRRDQHLKVWLWRRNSQTNAFCSLNVFPAGYCFLASMCIKLSAEEQRKTTFRFSRFPFMTWKIWNEGLSVKGAHNLSYFDNKSTTNMHK